MLPKSSRLTRAQFDSIFHSSERFSSEHFLLRVSREDFSHPQISVTVSKKVIKSAAARNRERRRVYAALERIENLSPKGYIFQIRTSTQLASFEDLSAEIRELLKTARALV